MTDKIVVLTACKNSEEAEKIARRLVEQKLAACVNLLPGARSFYRWKDVIENSEEVLLLIKSSRALFNDLRAAIEKLHSYELPEVVAMPIVDGSEAYLEWLAHGLLKQEE